MKKRIQVTINPELVVVAREQMAQRKFASLSEYVEALIREAWERQRCQPLSSLPKPADVADTAQAVLDTLEPAPIAPAKPPAKRRR